MEHFVKTLKALPETVTEFSDGAWGALVDYMTVYSEKDIRLTFRSGMEVRI